MSALLLDPHGPRPQAPADEKAGAAKARRALPWWSLLAVGWLAQAGVRIWLAAGQTMPLANPDETGYLFGARLLTGGPAADISGSTLYRAGYSLLLLPACWLGGNDPQAVYRLALVTNALVGAVLLPLAYLLLRRLGLTRGWSYAAAHATALLPAAVFFTQYALTDAVLPVVMLGWLLLLHSWLAGAASPAKVTLHGVGAGLVAGYSYALHSRGVVVLLVHAGLLLAAVVLRWRPWWSAGLSVLAAGCVIAVGTALNTWIWPQLYPQGSYEMGTKLADRFTTLDGYAWTLSVGTGQFWYLVVGTWGLAGIGLLAVAAAAFGRGTPARPRAMALGVLATTAGIAYAAAAALPDEQRVGNHAYGRYLACLAPLLFAVGTAVLLRARRRTAALAAAAAAAVTVAIAVLIEVRAGSRFDEYVFFSFDFPETGFLTWTWTSLRLWVATLAGLALLALAVAVAGLRRHGAAVLVAVLLAVNLAADVAVTWQVSRPFARDLTTAADLKGLADPVRTPRVAIDGGVYWKLRVLLLYQVTWTRLVWFDGRAGQRPPTDVQLVLLPWPEDVPAERTWPDAPPAWRVVGGHRGVETGVQAGWVAWRRDGS